MDHIGSYRFGQSAYRNLSKIINPFGEHNRQCPSTKHCQSKLKDYSVSRRYQTLCSQSNIPQELAHLIINEEKNLKKFKIKIQSEKKKVQEDFLSFKKQINYMIDDAKLSLESQLDNIYLSYMNQYAQLKNQIQQIRHLRKQYEIHSVNKSIQSKSFHGSINNELINQLQEDIKYSRQIQNNQYAYQNNKQKWQPILISCKNLLKLQKYHQGFYIKKQMNQQINSIRKQFANILQNIYQNINQYVISIHSIQSNINLNHLSLGNTQNIFSTNQQNSSHVGHSISNQNHKLKKSKVKNSNHEDKLNDQIVHSRVVSYKSNNKIMRINHNQRGILTSDKTDKYMLEKISTIQTDHSDSILCMCFINKYIVTGSKDRTIQVYDLHGNIVKKLYGHNSSICYLSVINTHNGDILASGSDHGCSSLILWDPIQWNIIFRKQYHIAAITSIIDLGDQCNILTVGYDKKIYLVNHQTSQATLAISYKSAITNAVLSIDQSKIIISGLDSTLAVFNIIKHFNNIQSLQQIRTIKCNSLICSLQPMILDSRVVVTGSKDGRITLYDIINGNVISSVVAHDGCIMELLTIQNQNKSSPLAITCAAKGTQLALSQLLTGKVLTIPTNDKISIQFGCGIGPKIIANNNGTLGVINQSPINRYFTLYKLHGQIQPLHQLNI